MILLQLVLNQAMVNSLISSFLDSHLISAIIMPIFCCIVFIELIEKVEREKPDFKDRENFLALTYWLSWELGCKVFLHP